MVTWKWKSTRHPHNTCRVAVEAFGKSLEVGIELPEGKAWKTWLKSTRQRWEALERDIGRLRKNLARGQGRPTRTVSPIH